MKNNVVRVIGRKSIELTTNIGRSIILLFQMLAYLSELWLKPKIFIQQVYSIGVMTSYIVVISALFIGMVLALQGYDLLNRFSAASSLGALVASSLLKELGPVVTALLFAGRAGSAITAEIGVMKATQQLDALEMMAVDPVKRILLPRFIAAVFSLPILNLIFICVGILSAAVFSQSVFATDNAMYWSQMTAVVSSGDIINTLIKSVVFGLVCGLIAVYQGYYANPAPQQVASATTMTVIQSAIVVLASDFILTAFMLA